MKSFNKKSIYILFGFIPGIAIGIVLTLLIFDLKTKKHKVPEQAPQITQYIRDADDDKTPDIKGSDEIAKRKNDNERDKKVRRKKEKTHNTVTTPDTIPIDTLNLLASDSIADTSTIEPLLHDSLMIADNSHTDTIIADTIKIDLAIQDTDYYDDNIVVMRDKLVNLKSALISGLSDITDEYDSLLFSEEDLADENSKIYRIEIWRSPVNYQGYKLAKNKVILYGINQYDSLVFWSSNDSIFLDHLEDTYLLEVNEDFRQLIPLHQPDN